MVHVPYLPLPVEPEPSSGFAEKAPIAHGILQLRTKDAPTSVVVVLGGSRRPVTRHPIHTGSAPISKTAAEQATRAVCSWYTSLDDSVGNGNRLYPGEIQPGGGPAA